LDRAEDLWLLTDLLQKHEDEEDQEQQLCTESQGPRVSSDTAGLQGQRGMLNKLMEITPSSIWGRVSVGLIAAH